MDIRSTAAITKTQETQRDPFFRFLLEGVCVRGGIGNSGLGSLAQQRRCGCVDGGRGGLQDPVCQQAGCERCWAEVLHWQMAKASIPSSAFVSSERIQRAFTAAIAKHMDGTYSVHLLLHLSGTVLYKLHSLLFSILSYKRF